MGQMNTFIQRSLRGDSVQLVQHVWIIKSAKLENNKRWHWQSKKEPSHERLPAILRLYIFPKATVDLEL